MLHSLRVLQITERNLTDGWSYESCSGVSKVIWTQVQFIQEFCFLFPKRRRENKSGRSFCTRVQHWILILLELTSISFAQCTALLSPNLFPAWKDWSICIHIHQVTSAARSQVVECMLLVTWQINLWDRFVSHQHIEHKLCSLVSKVIGAEVLIMRKCTSEAMKVAVWQQENVTSQKSSCDGYENELCEWMLWNFIALTKLCTIWFSFMARTRCSIPLTWISTPVKFRLTKSVTILKCK